MFLTAEILPISSKEENPSKSASGVSKLLMNRFRRVLSQAVQLQNVSSVIPTYTTKSPKVA
jgi:hypothetical protein